MIALGSVNQRANTMKQHIRAALHSSQPTAAVEATLGGDPRNFGSQFQIEFVAVGEALSYQRCTAIVTCRPVRSLR